MNRDERRNWTIYILVFLTLMSNEIHFAEGEMEELCEDETIQTQICPLRPGSSFKLNQIQNWSLSFDVCESDLLPICVTAPRTTTTIQPSSVEPPTTTTTTTARPSTLPPPTAHQEHKSQECEEDRSRCDMSMSWLTSKTTVDVNLLISHSTVANSNVSEHVKGSESQKSSFTELHDTFKNLPIFNPHSIVTHHQETTEDRFERRPGNAATYHETTEERFEGRPGNAAAQVSGGHAQYFQNLEENGKTSAHREDSEPLDIHIHDKYWKTLADVWKAEARLQALAHRQRQRLLNLENGRQSHAHERTNEQEGQNLGQGHHSRHQYQNTGSMKLFWDYFRPM